MDLFNRARKAFTDLASSASAQGRIFQVQAELADLETDLEHQQREAGRIARTLWRQRKFADTDFEIIMRRITEIEKEMEAKRAEVNELQQESAPAPAERCGQCGRELDPEDEFCRGCGARKP
jgi:hypothetical protein